MATVTSERVAILDKQETVSVVSEVWYSGMYKHAVVSEEAPSTARYSVFYVEFEIHPTVRQAVSVCLCVCVSLPVPVSVRLCLCECVRRERERTVTHFHTHLRTHTHTRTHRWRRRCDGRWR